MFFDRPDSGQRAVLVHVRLSRLEEREETVEFHDLVRSAGIEPRVLVSGRRRQPHPRWYLGAGKLDELRVAKEQAGADLVLFNHDLSPAQQRNVERALDCRVIGRTELILHIFARRARTHEGQLQVELAQLKHAETRLVRGWTHLDRQKGGIGLRGAGETQLELDQRMLNDRIRGIEQRLDGVRRSRVQGRRKRRRASVATVVLVGYTNAGKSTLFNRLSRSDVLAQDQLFATLDPTLRRLPIDGLGAVVLADTVGFIRDLPHSLVAAFKATLEEVAEADLLLHVVDANATDIPMHTAQVQRVLEEIGAGDCPVLEVYNKIDAVASGRCGAHRGPEGMERAAAVESTALPRVDFDAGGVPERVWMSAATGAGTDLLRNAIATRLGVETAPRRVLLQPSAGKTRSWLYDMGAVVGEHVQESGELELTVRLNAEAWAYLSRQPGVAAGVVGGVVAPPSGGT